MTKVAGGSAPQPVARMGKTKTNRVKGSASRHGESVLGGHAVVGGGGNGFDPVRGFAADSGAAGGGGAA